MVKPGRAKSAMTGVAGGCAVFLLLAALARSGDGRETSFWVIERDADFVSGTPEHVSVKRPGVVVLAPELDTLFSSEENYFWCLAADERGTVYAGSGDGGRVYSIDSRGRTELVMDSLDLEVLSLAVDARGAVYAGTAPGGLIWKNVDGESSVFFETGESYVWCLAFDDSGNLYAGTGDGGKVYKIRPNGKGEVFYETGERHVMCAQYAKGRLVVGTEGTGLVLAIDANGKGRVLFDCDEQEVRDVACVDGGVTYAAAIARTRTVAGPALDDAPSQSGEDQDERKQGSSVYRITDDGTASKVWTSGRSTVYCLWAAAGDSLLMGTGDEGRILCLSQSQTELVDRVADSQVLDMMNSEGRLVFSTGNNARVFSAGPKASRSGTLVSKAFDTGGVSRWGALSWNADVPRGASLQLQLRSGNSETPNRTWSDWSEDVARSGAVADIPPGRFVQWKARLTSGAGASTPGLRKISLAFAKKNLAPVVTGVRVYPQGVQFADGGIDRMPERVSQTLPGGLRVEYSVVKDDVERAVEEAAWARTLRTATWEASDPNGDKLEFTVSYRRPEEEKWKLIDLAIEETVFVWNTSDWPDGSYLLRVEVTDLPKNLPSEALTSEAVGVPFDVDNTAPVVSRLKSEDTAQGTTVTGTLSDALSAVTELHYSLDSGGWTLAQAADGLLDSRTEDFSIMLDTLTTGEHTVGLRAIDGAGNVGTGSLLIRR